MKGERRRWEMLRHAQGDMLRQAQHDKLYLGRLPDKLGSWTSASSG